MAIYLVTGGAGFIGTNLAKALRDKGHIVRIYDNYVAGNHEYRKLDGVEYIKASILDRKALFDAMKGVDGVFHFAALPRVSYTVEHPIETHEVNVLGSLKVFSAARDAGVKRVVFASSSAVYGDHQVFPYTENMKSDPQSPYATQKHTVEQYAKFFADTHEIETVSLRFFNVYGPYFDPEGAYALVIGKFLTSKKDGKPLPICGDGECSRDYVHTDDVVRAAILAMDAKTVGKGEVINIGTGIDHSVNQLAEMIGGETTQVPARAGDQRKVVADTTRAKELLGWEPKISFVDGIEALKKEMAVQ